MSGSFSASRGLHRHGRSTSLDRALPGRRDCGRFGDGSRSGARHRQPPRRLQIFRLRSSRALRPSTGQPGAPDPAEAKKQEHLQKIRQLTFDRRPSSILKAWSTPREEALTRPESDDSASGGAACVVPNMRRMARGMVVAAPNGVPGDGAERRCQA